MLRQWLYDATSCITYMNCSSDILLNALGMEPEREFSSSDLRPAIKSHPPPHTHEYEWPLYYHSSGHDLQSL